jgi:hypothetical protein
MAWRSHAIVSVVLLASASIGGCGEDSDAASERPGAGGSAASGGTAGSGTGASAGSSWQDGGGTTAAGAAGAAGSGGVAAEGGAAGLPASGAGGISAAGGAGGVPAAGGAGGAAGTSVGGSAGASGAAGAGAACGLPEAQSSPSGSFAWRFDVATLDCSTCGQSCDAADTSCLCLDEWQHLNYSSQTHLLALGAERMRPAVWAQGNYAAVYLDDFDWSWTTTTGAARADEIIASESADWPSLLPTWFLVNEISPSQWPANSAYRDFVVEFAARLHDHHNRRVVMFAPFPAPGNAWSQWPELAAKAYVGAESYGGTTGKAVNASGNSVAYCEGEYQKTIDAYASVGVPLDRLFLVEHFGNSVDDGTNNWGRLGVSAAGWKNAIVARSTAARNLGFAGFVSYGWAQNGMQESSANRIDFEDTYAAQVLP